MNKHNPNRSNWVGTIACITQKGNTSSKHKQTSPTVWLGSQRGGQLHRPSCYLSQILVKFLPSVLAPQRHGVSASVSLPRSSSHKLGGGKKPRLPVDLSLGPSQILPSCGSVSSSWFPSTSETKPSSSFSSLLSVL